MSSYGYSAWSNPSYLSAAALPPAQAPIIEEVPAWAAGGEAEAATGSVDAGKLSRAAAYQVAKAYAGSRLASAEQAEDAHLFARTALNNAGAYLKSAYWMAVAARILGSRMLALSAQAAGTKGQALVFAPGAGEVAIGSVARIFRDAAATVRGYAGPNLAAQAVASRLDALAAESESPASRKQAAAKTWQPLDDFALASEKYGKGAIVGGVAVAGIATWALFRAFSGRRK